ncbi:MAG: dihydropteroate synthase [Eggerthellaceae bacterium]|nr:dihydropteroate synthase [Eggerthellaceae bacterium]
MIWQCGRYSFDSRMPVIMGILNVTPDSFSDGGQHNSFDDALVHAHRMVDEGALIIDVGGESTRPGSAEVSVDEEIARTVEVVRALAAEDICVSIDTRHANVARACVEAGAAIINDVSGFRDPEMVKVATECDAGLVVMHMQGEPGTMQDNPTYTDVVAEVRDYLRDQAAMLVGAGVAPERISLDPGPGFGKTPKQTLELMRNLQEIVHLGYPVVAAPSRKRYVGETYGIDNAADRDDASATEALMACELGASVVRMHNVAVTAAMLEHLRPYCVLALGANVALVGTDDEVQEALVAQLNQAIAELCQLPDSQLIDVSSYYESEPAYVEDQAKFVNTVALMRTSMAPRDVLRAVHVIEDGLGRVRTLRNGPRTCDIDILDYQLYVSNDEELTLPHPRILERDFVVKPLLEILPNHVLADGTQVTADHVTLGWASKLK